MEHQTSDNSAQRSDLWYTLKALASVIDSHHHEKEYKDHSARVADWCRTIGLRLGMDSRDIELMEYTVLLHDVGEIHIRETLFTKPGRLTPDEYLEIQAHPVESERIISRMPHMEKAALWARWHHEWWDGSGYPDRLSGNSIPLPCRILVTVDSFDAMMTPRPYRDPLPFDEAKEELKLMAGIQFDPQVVQTLLEILETENP